MLARKVQSPTTRDMKFLKHLVEYVATTIDYHLVMKWGCPGKSVRDRRDSVEAHPSLDGTTHLIEVLTDSDWAGSPDRKSLSYKLSPCVPELHLDSLLCEKTGHDQPELV